jgi:hypothetical protein
VRPRRFFCASPQISLCVPTDFSVRPHRFLCASTQIFLCGRTMRHAQRVVCHPGSTAALRRSDSTGAPEFAQRSRFVRKGLAPKAARAACYCIQVERRAPEHGFIVIQANGGQHTRTRSAKPPPVRGLEGFSRGTKQRGVERPERVSAEPRKARFFAEPPAGAILLPKGDTRRPLSRDLNRLHGRWRRHGRWRSKKCAQIILDGMRLLRLAQNPSPPTFFFRNVL